ncbi:hypothetical protein GIB67_001632 [Kingdonia uniflora]|uniref:Homeobox-leucine zipper protein n=1 Tax=Kingdonia uniflora TaxID=39325 RepID=A0A7J7L0U4_9MAGN|nr:hypothetical protein GIB67_001632 [Kingdonia uniflora]
MMLERGEKSTTPTPTPTTTRKSKNKEKRRFNDDQIKSLESMFKTETKLEPRLKLQLAKELGLQPRQIAIWFQNRRARWKTKQLERDYSILKDSYDDLASRFQSLNKEKQSLMLQLQKLKDLLGKPREESKYCRLGLDRNSSTDGDSDYADFKYETEQKPDLSFEEVRNEKSKNVNYFWHEEEEHDLKYVTDPGEGVLESPGNWCSPNSATLFDQSSGSSQWWEIWS